jgi:DNA-binding NarL/FixJ family response regulator
VFHNSNPSWARLEKCHREKLENADRSFNASFTKSFLQEFEEDGIPRSGQESNKCTPQVRAIDREERCMPGKHRTITPEKRRQIIRLAAKGATYRQIAKEVDLSNGAVGIVVKPLGGVTPQRDVGPGDDTVVT